MPRFCRYCGNQLSDTAKFCKGCGNAVPQGSAGAVPKPAPEAQNSNVCPFCGAGIRPGVRFCRNCGQTVAPQPMASAAPQNMTAQYQQRINNSKAQTTEKKKEPSKLPIVLTAVVCVIIMAVGIFAIGRTVLPGLLSSDGSVAESGEGKAFTRGNSKAFSEEIVDGVTISAEKNALDKNRKFTMEEVSAEKYEELADSYQKKYDEPGLLYDVWELDAGLKDDEVLPGTYRIDMENCTASMMKETGMSTPRNLMAAPSPVTAIRTVWLQYCWGLEQWPFQVLQGIRISAKRVKAGLI